jgi:hypothetical protein
LAKKVLLEAPSETVKPPVLPTFKDLNGNIGKEILADNPPNVRAATQIKTGAIERMSGASMGENLRRERILGNRPPVEKIPPAENNDGLESAPPVRSTGAVKRQPRSESSNGETPIRQSLENIDLRNTNRIRPNGGNNNNNENESQPVRKPRIRSDEREIAPPVYNPPQPEGQIKRQQPRPPRRERQEEPVRQEPPRQEPRVEAPTRIEPPRREPVRQEEPPPRQDSPAEKPAAPTNEIKGKPEKDG